MHKGDYAYAAYYYRRALFICDSLGLPDRNKFPVYYGLGQTYMELRDFELSNHYYELAGNFFPQMSVSEKWTYLNNRGNHFYYKNRHKTQRKAKFYLNNWRSVFYMQGGLKQTLA